MHSPPRRVASRLPLALFLAAAFAPAPAHAESVASSASPSPPDCADRCDDRDYTAARLDRECAAPSTAEATPRCTELRRAFAAADHALSDRCPCDALRAERRRERRFAVGVAIAPLSGAPRVVTELNLLDGRWTVAAFLGVGRPGTRDPATDRATGSVWGYELGAQLRGYPLGSFTRFGVALGVEARYARAQIEDARLQRGGSVPGLLVGPVVALRVPDLPILHTAEITAGIATVVHDAREDGSSRVVPFGSVGVEWLF
ncbi:MAG: hypothetical protein NVS3B10_15290 [Polyangiales bacterium]